MSSCTLGEGIGVMCKEDPPRVEEEEEEEEETRYLVGFFEVSVVGLQYYHGSVTRREMVRLIREPENPYDRNAIKVENMLGDQVGHVERAKAAFLAPLVDTGDVTVEGIVPRPPNTRFRMPCHVYVFSPLRTLPGVLNLLRAQGVAVATPSQDSGFPRNDDSDENEIETEVLTRPPEPISLDAVFDSLLPSKGSDDNGAIVAEPSPIVTTPLMTHQKEALGWLLARENSADLPPFWQTHSNPPKSFVNTLTNFKTETRPPPFRGGILADDMGLGKTLTILALIAHSPPPSLPPPPPQPPYKKPSKKRQKVTLDQSDLSLPQAPPRSTLVVCPLNVMPNWRSQLETHIAPSSLSYHIYHGPERIRNADSLTLFDVVFTTYSILAAEGDTKQSPLQRVKWLRVVLDEAHLIKSPNASQTRAAVALEAERRWAVTGTPIQNSIDDFYSLLLFLKLKPLNDKSYWNRTISRPLRTGESSGLSRMKALMLSIALRRTKDTVVNGRRLIELPKKTVSVHYVELSPEDRRFYDEFELKGKQLVSRYMASGTVLENYATVLVIILRLRQICDHSSLCPQHEEIFAAVSTATGDLASSPELLQKLLSVLQGGDEFDCPICLSPPISAIITSCAHIFCKRCMEKTLVHDKPQCPMCRAKLAPTDIFSSPVTEPMEIEQTESGNTPVETNGKIGALIKLLTRSRERDPSVKSVVFSQFTGMLNLVEGPLKAAGFNYVRLDGTMSAKKKEIALEAFQKPGPNGPMVFLLGLKAAGLGLNLVTASQVYMLDPWWNPAAEEQAMDRIHRLGQTRDVEVVRLIVRDSIEERILQMQEQKRNLARSAFDNSPEQRRQMRVHDVQLLMQL